MISFCHVRVPDRHGHVNMMPDLCRMRNTPSPMFLRGITRGHQWAASIETETPKPVLNASFCNLCEMVCISVSRHIESTNGHRENQAVTVPESVYFSGIIVRRRQSDIFFDHNSIPNDYGPRGQHGERQ